MENHTQYGRWFYGAGVLFLLSAYLFPVVFYLMNRTSAQTETAVVSWPLLLPMMAGIVNWLVLAILGRRVSRGELLRCLMIVKYGLIPFFVMGGILAVCSLLMIFIPVVIMVFVAPALALTIGAYGWIMLLMEAPLAIVYIRRACRDGIIGKKAAVWTGILQFFFTADVIAITVLAILDRGKQKVLGYPD